MVDADLVGSGSFGVFLFDLLQVEHVDSESVGGDVFAFVVFVVFVNVGFELVVEAGVDVFISDGAGTHVVLVDEQEGKCSEEED